MTVTPIPPFDLSVQFQQIGDAINQAALTVLASGRYIGGATVEQFEREFAAYHGMAECVACNSGTDALYLALRALGIGVGDEVITTPFTFFATAEMISLTGATPVFVDIDATFNLDPNKVAAAITPQTKAIMPVHLFGRSADMGAIGVWRLLRTAPKRRGRNGRVRKSAVWGKSVATASIRQKIWGRAGTVGR
jgi:dTDP-4-amino-4,6-dideoxygalactose transaminase